MFAQATFELKPVAMKTLIITLLLCISIGSVSAQRKLAHYFPGAHGSGKADVEQLIDNFIQPLGVDISVLPNNGWYSTAKTHKRWGFDLSVTVNSVFVTNEDKFYSFPSNLSTIDFQTTNKGSTTIPTVYGPESENPLFEILSGPNVGVRYQGADGFDPASEYFMEVQPIYTIQGGLGIFKNTDLRFRFTPQTTISSVEFGNWGVGLMHDVKQYITGATDNKFAISVFAGYTQINGAVDLSGIYSGSDQEAKVSASGFTGQAIVSKEFGIITLYGALGYDTGNTTIDINGTYNVDSYIDADFGDKIALPQTFTLTDPFAYEYKKSGMRFTGGLRFRFGPVTLNGDYSFVGDKQVLTLGLGFLTDAKRD